jgi:hypothetical protein
MKRVLIVLAIVVLFPLTVHADPWLTCTNVPAGSWDTIGVKVDSATEVFVAPKVNTDGTITLWYDLAGITVGNHAITLRGKKGVWYSPLPFVYNFVRPNVPNISAPSLSE